MNDLILSLALLAAAFLANYIAPANKSTSYSRSRAATPWDVVSILRGKKASNEPNTVGLLIVLVIIWATAAYLE